MRAHQIMTRQVITVGPETPVVEAANRMLNHHISGLPVVDVTGKVIGHSTCGNRDTTRARPVAAAFGRPGPNRFRLRA
jgi:CBS-domain-containing membrane protein